jgi:site-specific DNA-methyltransferase (cytosine-N4-specific)
LAFIDALCAASPKKEYLASEIRSLAIARNPDVAFDRGSLPNDVLQPLADAGLITFKAGGTASGKSSTLSVTESFNRNVLEVFVRETVKDLDVAIASYYRKRPADIYAELRSTNKAVKGRALEALAIRLMRLLGLRFIAWNNRAKDTGYAEVDAVLAGVFGAVPTRWQIQCKNTPGSSRVDLEDIAKEVGLTPITRATHVLFLANNGFTSEARKFAAEIMQNTALTIFLLGSREFGMLEKDDTVLGGLLRQQAEEIVRAVRRNSVFDWK